MTRFRPPHAPLAIALAAMCLIATPALSRSALASFDSGGSEGAGELPPYLQCVPYARQVSGIEIYGDAHTWWGQAEGRYARGSAPRTGAVMAFRPFGNMKLGHVAAVSRVLDSRTVLLRHANWSELDGRRGQIEDNVRAIDVSPNNDWSEVRVWYAPIQGLGTTHWPVEGFIYKDRIGRDRKGGTVREPQVAPARFARAETPRKAVPAPASTKQLARFDGDPIGAIIAASRARR